MSLSSYYPKANKHLKLAGLLACSILDAFPFPIGTVAFGVIEDTFGAYSSGVCSGFSPDSLFTHHLKKRGDKHQNQKQIYNNSGSPPNFYLIKKATIVFYKQYIIKQEKHLKSLFQTLEVHIIVSVVLFCKCCHDKVRKLTATQKGLLSIFMFIGLSRTFR